jgi:hypothetical protein
MSCRHRFLSAIFKPYAVLWLTCLSTRREVSHDARGVLAVSLRPIAPSLRLDLLPRAPSNGQFSALQ